MNLTSKHAIAIAVFMIALLAVLIFVMKSTGSKKPDPNQPHVELSAWLADWQWGDGLDEFRQITEGLTSLQAFAVYFDDKDNLHLTEELREALPQIVEASKQSSLVYVDLTIVNDVILGDGTSVQKDPALVTRLMATEQSRKKHIDNILAAVTKYDVRGVEIDYENIRSEDWDHVLAFYRELYERLRPLEKSLRIVLEPRAPIDKLKLPEGPVYVMMAYNLFGNHSGPGPKADHAFIADLARRMDKLPGEPFIAFAAGGFDWAESGKVASVTAEQAAELSQLSQEAPRRDAGSGSLYFHYTDDNNVKHTVWYADHVTLAQWIDDARQAGYEKIALWKLGGLGQETLKELNRY
ncbi:glycosyl hydrolase family 18 protein [Brevibacillus borstelensis]|uniref:glycosyl hydrolase family 18 protein n=2 Tax=Brevibacillus borstelensis TaxID=45462 RepID=UPI0030CFB37B